MKCPTCHRPEACESSADCPHARLTVLAGDGNPDDDIDFSWRPFKVLPPPSDGCRTCHRPWTECVC